MNQVKDYSNENELDSSFFGRQYLFNVFSHNSEIDLDRDIPGFDGTWKALDKI